MNASASDLAAPFVIARSLPRIGDARVEEEEDIRNNKILLCH